MVEEPEKEIKTIIGKDNFLEAGVLGVVLLDARRAKENGLFPVKVRLTHQRKQIYLNAGYDFTTPEWGRLQSAKEGSPLYKKKTAITAYFKTIQKTINEIAQTGEYSHEKLLKLLKKGRTDSLSASIENIIMELKKDGQVGSASVYSNTIKSIVGYAKRDLKFSDITPKWLTDYEKAVNNDLSYTTIGIYLRTLRAVFNRAITDSIITEASYPFSRNERDGKYRIPTGTGTKIALTIEQMAAVANYTAPTKSIERSRDMFLLSFHLGGINFKDLLLLKWSDIKNGEITFIREKTKRTTKQKDKAIYIPVNEPALKLIDKLTGNSNGGYILPFMTANATPADVLRITQNITRNTNKHLNEIGKSLGIQGLSTYVARHSFATIMKNSGVPVAFISETLGHNDVKTTENYLKSFEADQRKKNFDVLNDILKK